MVEERRLSQEEVLSKSNNNEIEELTVRDYFIKYLFADAIIYGMSYDEFWNKDPELFFSYRFSYLKRLKLKREEINYSSWLNGLYNYRAYAVSLHNAFDGKNNPIEYYRKPIDFETSQKEESTSEDTYIKKRNFWSRFKEKHYISRKE